MKAGIMQPYFFPYIGYWQLIHAADIFVVFDDVSFMKRGWIHRNRILVSGRTEYIRVPLLKASQNKRIDEIRISRDGKELEKPLRMIAQAYRKAPYFARAYRLAEEAVAYGYENDSLSEFLFHSISLTCRYLGIRTQLLQSSRIEKDENLRGQEKILAICRKLGASDYYNAIGGMGLYDFSVFQEQGIGLHFLKTGYIPARKPGCVLDGYLSVIDDMMFHSAKEINEMLGNYQLIENRGGGDLVPAYAAVFLCWHSCLRGGLQHE